MVVLVEGIPGSGKTLYADAFYDYCANAGVDCARLKEHSRQNAIDITRKAVLEDDEYSEIIESLVSLAHSEGVDEQSVSRMRRSIYKATSERCNKLLVSYLEIQMPTVLGNAPLLAFREREYCDGRAGLESYKSLIVELITAFAEGQKEENQFSVIDGSFIQNILFELLAQYCLSFELIVNFYIHLLRVLSPLGLRIIYLASEDVEVTVERAMRYRSDIQWGFRITKWFNETGWSRNHGASGKEGLLKYFEEQERIGRHIVKIAGKNGVLVNSDEAIYSLLNRRFHTSFEL